MIHSVKIIRIIKNDEDPFEWEQKLPEELFKPKYNFDGGDIGPFGSTDEPMKRTLFWYPKNSELAEELCNLIVKHGYRASRDYIPTVD